MPSSLIRIQSLPPIKDNAGLEIIELPMTSEDRQRVRRRLKASDGQELALMLPTGTTLRIGNALYRNAQKAYVVTAAPEDVLVVKPKSLLEAARIGHLIGNMHRDIDVVKGEDDGDVVTLWMEPLEAQFKKAGFVVTRERRPFKGNPPGEHAHSFVGRLDELLPPRYQNGAPVSSAPMRSAELTYDDAGRVSWDRMWGSFCDLALAGGPTHRGTLLEPPTAVEVQEQPKAYETVVAEIERGIELVTGLETVKSPSLGWVGVRCQDEAMAVWLLRAIIVENVMVRRQHDLIFLPAGPSYRLEKEIKNVITVIAKTHHYWAEHLPKQSKT